MRTLLLCLALASLPVLAVTSDELQDARLEVSEHPDAALTLAEHTLADPNAKALYFQALLLKSWAELKENPQNTDISAALEKLKALAAEGTTPLLKADYAFLRASVAMEQHADSNTAQPLLEEAMSYCRPFSQMAAYRYCAEITAYAANSYAFSGDLTKAKTLIGDSYRFAKLGGSNGTYLDVKLLEAALARRQGDSAKALTLLKEAELEAQQMGEKRRQGRALSRQGLIYLELSQYSQAEQNLMDALALFEQQGDKADTAETFRYLGQMMLAQNKTNLAIVQFYNALDIANQLHWQVTASRLMLDIGQTYHQMGNLKKAQDFLSRAMATMESHNLSLYLPRAHYQMALLYEDKKQDDKAAIELNAALDGTRKNPTVERQLELDTMNRLVALYERQGKYKAALDMAKAVAALPAHDAPRQPVTIEVVAPPTPFPQHNDGTPPWIMVVTGVVGLILGVAVTWLLTRRRRPTKPRKDKVALHPASGFLSMQGFLNEGDKLLGELRLAMDVTNAGSTKPDHQPLAAILCNLPGMASAYETYGFEQSRQELRRFAKQLQNLLPEARMMVQPSRDYLLFVLPSPTGGKEMQLTERLRQVISLAAKDTFLDMKELCFAGTLLPLLPYHPRVGSAMTVFETLLFTLSLGCIGKPFSDLWLIGQSCTLPSAMSDPLRESLGEAMQNGTVKVVGLPYGELTQRLQQLAARQETFKVNWPTVEEAQPIV
ncbi:tetratricopeptide repeat protein [Gallaecimonas pentaromativorans]|uniref:tetratricopeptide repeat protein n=1 Tax=Gallaecimonas pentaromativorans TaxID=584787 RepID=UPI003A9562EF